MCSHPQSLSHFIINYLFTSLLTPPKWKLLKNTDYICLTFIPWHPRGYLSKHEFSKKGLTSNRQRTSFESWWQPARVSERPCTAPLYLHTTQARQTQQWVVVWGSSIRSCVCVWWAVILLGWGFFFLYF